MTTTKVYGWYRTAEDEPETGSVSLTPEAPEYNDTGQVRRVSKKPVVGRLDADGYFEVQVIASDDVGWRAAGDVPYTVAERISGELRIRKVIVPGGADVDVNTLPDVP